MTPTLPKNIEHLDELSPEELGQVITWELTRVTPSIPLIMGCIQAGVDLNAKDKSGLTLLHLAAEKGRPGVIDILVSHGVDINLRCSFGMTALHYAVRNDRYESVKRLIAAGADLDAKFQDITPLHIAASRGNLEIAEALIDAGAYLDIQNEYGSTALHLAVRYARHEVPQGLVKMKAEGRHREIVRALVKAGADKKIQDNKGKKAMNLAPELWNELV